MVKTTAFGHQLVYRTFKKIYHVIRKSVCDSYHKIGLILNETHNAECYYLAIIYPLIGQFNKDKIAHTHF